MPRTYEMTSGAVFAPDGSTVPAGTIVVIRTGPTSTTSAVPPATLRRADGSNWPTEGVVTDDAGKVTVQWPGAGPFPDLLYTDTGRGVWPMNPVDLSARVDQAARVIDGELVAPDGSTIEVGGTVSGAQIVAAADGVLAAPRIRNVRTELTITGSTIDPSAVGLDTSGTPWALDPSTAGGAPRGLNRPLTGIPTTGSGSAMAVNMPDATAQLTAFFASLQPGEVVDFGGRFFACSTFLTSTIPLRLRSTGGPGGIIWTSKAGGGTGFRFRGVDDVQVDGSGDDGVYSIPWWQLTRQGNDEGWSGWSFYKARNSGGVLHSIGGRAFGAGFKIGSGLGFTVYADYSRADGAHYNAVSDSTIVSIIKGSGDDYTGLVGYRVQFIDGAWTLMTPLRNLNVSVTGRGGSDVRAWWTDEAEIDGALVPTSTPIAGGRGLAALGVENLQAIVDIEGTAAAGVLVGQETVGAGGPAPGQSGTLPSGYRTFPAYGVHISGRVADVNENPAVQQAALFVIANETVGREYGAYDVRFDGMQIGLPDYHSGGPPYGYLRPVGPVMAVQLNDARIVDAYRTENDMVVDFSAATYGPASFRQHNAQQFSNDAAGRGIAPGTPLPDRGTYAPAGAGLDADEVRAAVADAPGDGTYLGLDGDGELSKVPAPPATATLNSGRALLDTNDPALGFAAAGDITADDPPLEPLLFAWGTDDADSEPLGPGKLFLRWGRTYVTYVQVRKASEPWGTQPTLTYPPDVYDATLEGLPPVPHVARVRTADYRGVVGPWSEDTGEATPLPSYVPVERAVTAPAEDPSVDSLLVFPGGGGSPFYLPLSELGGATGVPTITGFSVSPDSGDAPLAVTATWVAAAVSPATLEDATIAWGDGSTTAAATSGATHTYADAGSYTATLTVTDSDDHTRTASDMVVIGEAESEDSVAVSRYVADTHPTANGAAVTTWPDTNTMAGRDLVASSDSASTSTILAAGAENGFTSHRGVLMNGVSHIEGASHGVLLPELRACVIRLSFLGFIGLGSTPGVTYRHGMFGAGSYQYGALESSGWAFVLQWTNGEANPVWAIRKAPQDAGSDTEPLGTIYRPVTGINWTGLGWTNFAAWSTHTVTFVADGAQSSVRVDGAQQGADVDLSGASFGPKLFIGGGTGLTVAGEVRTIEAANHADLMAAIVDAEIAMSGIN